MQGADHGSSRTRDNPLASRRTFVPTCLLLRCQLSQRMGRNQCKAQTTAAAVQETTLAPHDAPSCQHVSCCGASCHSDWVGTNARPTTAAAVQQTTLSPQGAPPCQHVFCRGGLRQSGGPPRTLVSCALSGEENRCRNFCVTKLTGIRGRSPFHLPALGAIVTHRTPGQRHTDHLTESMYSCKGNAAAHLGSYLYFISRYIVELYDS
jgi:hypothetical protein